MPKGKNKIVGADSISARGTVRRGHCPGAYRMRPYGTLFSGAKATQSTCFIIFYLLSFILLKQIFRQNDVAFRDL